MIHDHTSWWLGDESMHVLEAPIHCAERIYAACDASGRPGVLTEPLMMLWIYEGSKALAKRYL
jgi:hypothetical protein